MVARWGDRGVLRSYSPVLTIGGCLVVDPAPPLRPRRPERLEDRAVADAPTRLVAFVAAAGWAGLTREDLAVRAGVHPMEVDEIVRKVVPLGIVAVQDRLLPVGLIDRARRDGLDALAAYHKEHHLEPGMPLELLRTALGSSDVADHVLAVAVEDGSVVVEGSSARLAEFAPRLWEREEQQAVAVRDALREAGPLGKIEGELEEYARGSTVRDLMEYLVREGGVVRVGRDRYYDRSAVRELRDSILAEVRERGRAMPAELREKTGLTRKYLIPFLEWLDGAGYTVRDGDGRRLGPRSEAGDGDS